MRVKPISTRKFKSSTDQQIGKAIRMKKSQLEQLQKENIQFKIVMQANRKKANQIDPNTFKQLQHLYEQTKTFQVKQDYQSKKYKLLKQLITYLEQQQIWNRKEQDMIRSALKANEQKQFKKREYDVEQVLQRCNQQVAKIGSLRQLLEVSRSQRVVYSNLFKKLQKQIRMYEQQFKQLLLQSSLIHEKRQISLNQSIQIKRKQQRVTAPIELQLSAIQEEFQIPNFTSLKKKKSPINTKKGIQLRTDRKFKQIKEVNIEQHQHYKLFIQTITIQSQCQDLNEFFFDFANIQSQNQTLSKKIDKVSGQINFLQSESRQGTIKEIQQDSELQNISLTIPLPPSKIDYSSKQNQIKQSQECLIQIAKLLGLEYQNIHINELFSTIQKSMSLFLPMQQLHVSKFFCQQLTATGRRGEDQQHQIENLIDKAQKYSQCQKILAKQYFEQQYSKQAGRVRRITKPKK